VSQNEQSGCGRPRVYQPPLRFPPRKGGQASNRLDQLRRRGRSDDLVIDDAKVFNDKLREWEDYSNDHRPQGGLDGQTPYERLRQKTQTWP
jgi:hypothetical protein